MFTTTLSETSNSIDNAIKALEMLQMQQAEVGLFASQGIHQSSGFTYAHLADIHSKGRNVEGDGWAVRIPPRPFLLIGMTRARNTLKRSRLVKKELRIFASKLGKGTPNSTITLLDTLGNMAGREVKNVIGNPALLRPNKRPTIRAKGGRNTPLVDTYDFKRHIAHRNSLRSSPTVVK